MAYTFDNISIKKDGKRIFPIMGEIHYSRVPRKEWKERLLKMKAGGITLVSSYVIWIHHEEVEGEYDWTAERDLHAFLEVVQECGMKLLLRIGPWVHAETRNGGFPDWLLHKDYEPRTNDEKYFAVVEGWYKKIYEQVKDFICNPEEASTLENPIIGVQIENEYGHCGGLYEKEGGESHMRRLQQMAIDTGFKLSLYTATGWGGSWTGGMLPVMGGYCDAPWDQRTTEIEPSGNYTFTHERNDHNIGSDHGFGYGITFDIEKFPYLTAELGGGLQVTSHRRTIATSKDIASVALAKLGSGVNLLGFYMYAGGTNPEGKLSTLQESRATGYLNDLPVKSYDFRAPVREFGQVSDTLRELKLLTMFTAEWGSELCSLPAEIPFEVKPDDLKTLRYAYRSDGRSGYLFVNNYVRHQKMASHRVVSLKSPDGMSTLPSFDVDDGDFFFLPFNMKYGDTFVNSARVTPLTKIKKDSDEIFVFYKRENDYSDSHFFDFAGKPSSKFLVLSRTDALNAWKMSDGRLVITDSDSSAIENEKGEIEVFTRTNGTVCVYPDFEKAPFGWKKLGEENKNAASDLDALLFAKYEVEAKNEAKGGILPAQKIKADENATTYRLDFSDLLSKIDAENGGISDAFVTLRYTGESARLYELSDEGRKLILDNFYLGEDYPWEIGLKRFKNAKGGLKNLELEILPLKKGAEIYIEKWPSFDGNEISVLNSADFGFERKILL